MIFKDLILNFCGVIKNNQPSGVQLKLSWPQSSKRAYRYYSEKIWDWLQPNTVTPNPNKKFITPAHTTPLIVLWTKPDRNVYEALSVVEISILKTKWTRMFANNLHIISPRNFVSFSGVCQEQHTNLLIAVMKAWDEGTPFCHFNWKKSFETKLVTFRLTTQACSETQGKHLRKFKTGVLSCKKLLSTRKLN